MRVCIWCGKQYPKKMMGNYGLCGNCNQSIVLDTKNRARILNDSRNLIEQSKNLKTKLSRFDLAKEHLQKLLVYEEKKIETIEPRPSVFLNTDFTVVERDNLIYEHFKNEVGNIKNKMEVDTPAKTKENMINKGLVNIAENKQELNDPSKLDTIQEVLTKLLHTIQYFGHLEVAKKAEFKGETKKAIDQYQEALYRLKTDNISDEIQAGAIEKLESKIEALKTGKSD